MTSTPRRAELLGDLELLAHVERDAGRLLAVPQGRVEDLHLVRASVVSVPSGRFGQRKTSPARRHEEASASTGGRSPLVRSRLWVRSSLVMKTTSTARSAQRRVNASSRRTRARMHACSRDCSKRLLGLGVLAAAGYAVVARATERAQGRHRRHLASRSPFPYPPRPHTEAPSDAPRRRRAAAAAAARPAPGSSPTTARARVAPGEGEADERHLPRAGRRELRPHQRRPLLRSTPRPPRPTACARQALARERCSSVELDRLGVDDAVGCARSCVDDLRRDRRRRSTSTISAASPVGPLPTSMSSMLMPGVAEDRA